MAALDPEQALELVLEHTPAPRGVNLSLTTAVGLTLAETASCGTNGDAIVLERGSPVTAAVAGLLAAIGHNEVSVIRPPSVAVVSVTEEPAVGVMLTALAREAGVTTTRHFTAEPTLEDLAFLLDHVSQADLVIVAGEVFSNSRDIAPQAMVHCGATIVFHGVAQDPGDRMLLATRDQQLLFGLPVEPTGMNICFRRYVDAAIRKWTARPPTGRFRGRLSGPLEVRSDRTRYVLASCTEGSGSIQVRPLEQGLVPSLEADAYVALFPGTYILADGSEVHGAWLDRALRIGTCS